MSTTIQFLIVVCAIGALVSAAIAWTRTRKASTTVALFILGAVAAPIGVVVSLLIPASRPQWLPDPWGQATWRWHDGRRWTEMTSGLVVLGASALQGCSSICRLEAPRLIPPEGAALPSTGAGNQRPAPVRQGAALSYVLTFGRPPVTSS
jgi:Protein of unknown function (DUF2510)